MSSAPSIDLIDLKTSGVQSPPLRGQILRHSLWMTLVGQVERVVGLLVTFALRWGLSASDLGVYSGLRLLLDNTNRSSLGVALGAVQKTTILNAQGKSDEALYITNVAATSNTITSSIYGAGLIFWGGRLMMQHEIEWGVGLVVVGVLAILKRRQDFHIAILRSESKFGLVGRLALIQSLVFTFATLVGIILAGFWGLIASLAIGFLVQSVVLNQNDPDRNFQSCWDWHRTVGLAATGLPILAANSSWAMLNTIDRALILTDMPDGATQAGYYSIAILATNWCSDIAGRVGLVLYPEYQRSIGSGTKNTSVLIEAEKASLILFAVLSFLSLWAILLGNLVLPAIFPSLATGVTAIQPMLAGSVALAATWPLRQAWTALDRPWVLATVAGCVVIPQYLAIQSVAGGGSIVEIAQTSSQFQVIATILLFAITLTQTQFQWVRLKWWTLTIACIAYCQAIESNLLLDLPFMGRSNVVFTIYQLLIASLPISVLAVWFYRNQFHKISHSSQMREN